MYYILLVVILAVVAANRGNKYISHRISYRIHPMERNVKANEWK